MSQKYPKFKEPINWWGWFNPWFGYGLVNTEMSSALNKVSGDMVTIPWEKKEPGTDEWKDMSEEQRYLHSKPVVKSRIGIIKTTPPMFHMNTCDFRIGYTMVENTQVGKEWVKLINEMDACFVPCPYLVDVFKTSGVKKPVYSVRQGVNPDHYPFVDRPKRPIFTFGTLSWLDDRKDWQDMFTAFTSEFAPNEPVRFLVKNSNPTWGAIRPKDPRIMIIDRRLSSEEIFKFYGLCDCFVFPSRAEGSGMPPKEAMATGCPAIVTNFSGLAELADERYSYPLNDITIDFPDGRPEQPGFMARINVRELMYWMRYAYEHQKENKEKGKEASKWMHTHWNWEVCASEILDILKTL
jgi:glycosyltransferase involved in cell wall biosynthesis